MLRNFPSNLLKARKHLLRYEQIRTSISNEFRHGPEEITNPKFDWGKTIREIFTKGEAKRLLKEEAIRIYKKATRSIVIKRVEIGKPYIFEHFDSNEAIKRWTPASDQSSYNGFSTASFTRSPAGHGLFSGNLDTTVPEDGVTNNSGFVAVMGPRAPRTKTFQTESHWNWTNYNAIEIKYRGDGRKYQVVLSTSTNKSDLEYYDTYSYPLYSQGGPYWQVARIPLKKFVFNYKGFIQDIQIGPLLNRINFVALALNDRVDGPFSFEVDYLALRKDFMPFEDDPYEEYSCDNIRWREVHVEVAPPAR